LGFGEIFPSHDLVTSTHPVGPSLAQTNSILKAEAHIYNEARIYTY
jgi:hypothetical protein